MKKLVILVLMVLLLLPIKTNAQRGCCSHHGGVAGCSSSGRQICNDGTLSPTCTCTPPVTYIYGCTDSSAKNYNSNANKDNGTCEYYIYGCTDPEAKNYNVNAEKDDGSWKYDIEIEKEEISTTVSHNNDNLRSNKEESNDDSSGIFYLIGVGALATYLHKRKKKKTN